MAYICISHSFVKFHNILAKNRRFCVSRIAIAIIYLRPSITNKEMDDRLHHLLPDIKCTRKPREVYSKSAPKDFYYTSRGLRDISSLIDRIAMLSLCNSIAAETIKRFHSIE